MMTLVFLANVELLEVFCMNELQSGIEKSAQVALMYCKALNLFNEQIVLETLLRNFYAKQIVFRCF